MKLFTYYSQESAGIIGTDLLARCLQLHDWDLVSVGLRPLPPNKDLGGLIARVQRPHLLTI